ncbi:MAG: hypothetical protein QOE59_5108 [Actinomycetota bacterium]|jgi:hypothetical protein|nr:hypothetical protein [Actinomycetota bacterium]
MVTIVGGLAWALAVIQYAVAQFDRLDEVIVNEESR